MRISDWSSDVCSSDLRLHRAAEPRILGRQETDAGHQQQRRVERLAVVVLHEGVAPGVVAPLEDLPVDLVASCTPMVDWAREIELLDRLHRPVDRHPGTDRTRVASGKTVYVSVDLGGRRFIKEQSNETAEDKKI